MHVVSRVTIHFGSAFPCTAPRRTEGKMAGERSVSSVPRASSGIRHGLPKRRLLSDSCFGLKLKASAVRSNTWGRLRTLKTTKSS